MERPEFIVFWELGEIGAFFNYFSETTSNLNNLFSLFDLRTTEQHQINVDIWNCTCSCLGLFENDTTYPCWNLPGFHSIKFK